jgi:O-antigen ligase
VAFTGGITAIVLFMTRANRGRWRWLLIVAALAAVLLSNSRASLVGLLAAGLFLAAWRVEITRLVKLVVVVVVAAIGLVVFVPRVGDTVGSLLDDDFQEQVSVVYSGGNRLSTSTAEANILRRVANYSNAQRFIASSPLIGIGAWRYDDELGSRTGVERIAAPYVRGERVHSDGHAHNVYLHIAAETGLVGLAFFAALWIGLLVAIRRADRRRPRPDELSPWLLAAWCGIAFGLGVSISDIGLINPALAFPLLIVVGTVLGYQSAGDLHG